MREAYMALLEKNIYKPFIFFLLYVPHCNFYQFKLLPSNLKYCHSNKTRNGKSKQTFRGAIVTPHQNVECVVGVLLSEGVREYWGIKTLYQTRPRETRVGTVTLILLLCPFFFSSPFFTTFFPFIFTDYLFSGYTFLNSLFELTLIYVLFIWQARIAHSVLRLQYGLKTEELCFDFQEGQQIILSAKSPERLRDPLSLLCNM